MFFKQLFSAPGHMMSIKLAFLLENRVFVAKAMFQCDFSLFGWHQNEVYNMFVIENVELFTSRCEKLKLWSAFMRMNTNLKRWLNLKQIEHTYV